MRGSEINPIEELVPDLALWNDGDGIALVDWILAEGRADHALGFCAMFWPDIVEIGDYFLRSPVNEARLKEWESSGATRVQVETVMNILFLEEIFPRDQTSPDLKVSQIDRMAVMMREMLAARLRVMFPDQTFRVFVIDDDDDFCLTFHRV